MHFKLICWYRWFDSSRSTIGWLQVIYRLRSFDPLYCNYSCPVSAPANLCMENIWFLLLFLSLRVCKAVFRVEQPGSSTKWKVCLALCSDVQLKFGLLLFLCATFSFYFFYLQGNYFKVGYRNFVILNIILLSMFFCDHRQSRSFYFLILFWLLGL